MIRRTVCLVLLAFSSLKRAWTWGVESAFVRATLALVPTLALVIGARAGEIVHGA